MEIGLVYDPTGDWLSLFLDELEPLLENLREGLQKLLYKQVFPQPTEEEMQQRIDYKVRQEQIRYWGRQVMKEHGW